MSAAQSSISTAKIAKYMFLPGIVPRLKDLFGSGFSLFAFLVASILGAVRLLPADHPYLNAENYGHFGLRHALAEAASHLVFDKRHIDQSIIYALILIGLVAFVLQFAALALALVGQPLSAMAAMSIEQIFGNPRPAQDIAFIMMDKVFGVEGVFNSCVADAGTNCEDKNGNQLPFSPAFPFPIHAGLHALFGVYSTGVFFIGIIVLLYFVVTIIGETAVSGTPFGQRFNKAWMPIRLVLFFALIVPLGSGLNLAQYGLLYLSKYGSNLATNGWITFADTLAESQQAGDMIAAPTVPELDNLMRFLHIARTCREAEILAYGDDIDAASHDVYVVKTGAGGEPERRLMRSMNFTQAHDFSDAGNIVVHFGHIDPDEEQLHTGGVTPSCGILQMPSAGMSNDNASVIQGIYYDLIREMYSDPLLIEAAQCQITPERFPGATTRACNIDYYELVVQFANQYNGEAQRRIQEEIDQQRLNTDIAVPPELLEKGWGGAAVWYNMIAEMNGAVTEAVFAVPQGYRYPAVLERVMEAQRSESESVPEDETVDPDAAQNLSEIERPIAEVLARAFFTWEPVTTEESQFNNPVLRTINVVLGTGGIFSMYENPDINPLAQTTALGKAMIEATIRNLAVAGAGAALNFIFEGFIGATGQAVSGFIMSIFSVTTLIGFTLFYVVPFLPFMYFILAVSAWVKSIFEAMVAMPLWAVAHISRIDGEGIPGPAASNGYYLLLEIFLRPIMTVLGLVAAVVTFSAIVQVLNETFQLAAENVGGTGQRGVQDDAGLGDIRFYRGYFDQFMYTMVYTVLVYVSGLQSFKLIDVIPKNILRWFGQSVAAFQEDTGDPAAEMIQQTYSTSQLALNQLRSTLRGDSPDSRAIAASLMSS